MQSTTRHHAVGLADKVQTTSHRTSVMQSTTRRDPSEDLHAHIVVASNLCDAEHDATKRGNPSRRRPAGMLAGMAGLPEANNQNEFRRLIDTLGQRISDLERRLSDAHAEAASGWVHPGSLTTIASGAAAGTWYTCGVATAGHSGNQVLHVKVKVAARNITTHGNFTLQVVGSDGTVIAPTGVTGWTGNAPTPGYPAGSWMFTYDVLHPWKRWYVDRANNPAGSAVRTAPGDRIYLQARRDTGTYDLDIYLPECVLWGTEQVYTAATAAGVWSTATA